MTELPDRDATDAELPDAQTVDPEPADDRSDGAGTGAGTGAAAAPDDAVTTARRPKVRAGVRRLLVLQATTVAALVAVTVVVISTLDAGRALGPDSGGPTTQAATTSPTTTPPPGPSAGAAPAVGSCARRESRSWQPADCALPYQGWVVAVVVDPGSDAGRRQACGGPATAAGVTDPLLVDAVPTGGGTLSCVALGLRP